MVGSHTLRFRAVYDVAARNRAQGRLLVFMLVWEPLGATAAERGLVRQSQSESGATIFGCGGNH